MDWHLFTEAVVSTVAVALVHKLVQSKASPHQYTWQNSLSPLSYLYKIKDRVVFLNLHTLFLYIVLLQKYWNTSFLSNTVETNYTCNIHLN